MGSVHLRGVRKDRQKTKMQLGRQKEATRLCGKRHIKPGMIVHAAIPGIGGEGRRIRMSRSAWVTLYIGHQSEQHEILSFEKINR